ncbi:Uncharacterised protein [Enterobacter hormaechei]|nr:Uncharacterised protein [Enterobacter hormaechei]VAE46343.1 Uncharacterised protein [Enterobacter hormaechei]VAF03992.1 Uncharacterised protein [Enterobacter hormaechei]
MTCASRYSPEIFPVIVTVFSMTQPDEPVLASITIVTEVFFWLPLESCSMSPVTPMLKRTRVTS